jgi:hypothetical protein
MTKRSQRLLQIAKQRMKDNIISERHESTTNCLERHPILRHGQHLTHSEIEYLVEKMENGTLEWTVRWIFYALAAPHPPTYTCWFYVLGKRNFIKDVFEDGGPTFKEAIESIDPIYKQAIAMIWDDQKRMPFSQIKELTLKQADRSITEAEHFLLFAGIWKNDDGSNLWWQLHSEQDSWLFQEAAWGEAFNLYKEARQLPSTHKTLPGLNRHLKPPLMND